MIKKNFNFNSYIQKYDEGDYIFGLGWIYLD